MRVDAMVFGVWCLEFGVWCLVFGVGDLEFQGLGFRVEGSFVVHTFSREKYETFQQHRHFGISSVFGVWAFCSFLML
jgi:hypothetical protein